jgi:hypothetical protein
VSHLVRRRPFLVAGVTIALIVVLVLGGRAAWRLGHRLLAPPPPRQTDVSLIADWMSLPYISRAYRVPEPELYRALGVVRAGRRMQRLREIASETGRSSDEVVGIVRETVGAWQESHPGPPTPISALSPPFPPPGRKDGAPDRGRLPP